jgi:hypothetical protein
MPAKRGKESFIRRQKEIARQQKQKDKQARREDRRARKGTGDSSELATLDQAGADEATPLGPSDDGS